MGKCDSPSVNKQSENTCSGINETRLPCQRCRLCPSYPVCPHETRYSGWASTPCVWGWFISQITQVLTLSWPKISQGICRQAPATTHLYNPLTPEATAYSHLNTFIFFLETVLLLSFLFHSLIRSPCSFHLPHKTGSLQ